MPDLIESVQACTHGLQMELEWMKAWRDEHPQDALEHLRHFQTQLGACGDFIRHAQSGSTSTELRRAICEYRECLQRVQEVLPIVQKQLLAQRYCLERQQMHLQAATRWAQGSKDTL
ncbi:MAG TPA: hypothetical protein VMT53_19605 [Terriglobales bacterium]|nr:hypothetical protein [Terriglobales bacterium]